MSLLLSAQTTPIDSLNAVLAKKQQQKQALAAEVQKMSSGGLMLSTKKLDKKVAELDAVTREIELVKEQIQAEQKADSYYKQLKYPENNTQDTITVKVLDYVRFMNWYNAEQMSIAQKVETIANADERYRVRNTYRRLQDLVDSPADLTYENVYNELGEKTPYKEVKIAPLPPKELTPYEKEQLAMETEKEELTKGWEWVDDEGDMERKEVAYPEKYTFYVHKAHPEYQIKYDFSGEAHTVHRPLVFKQGKLVRVNEISRENLPETDIKKAVYRRDFQENKYNVTDEIEREFIKHRLGLPSMLDEVDKAFYEKMRKHRAELAIATTDQEARKAVINQETTRYSMGAIFSSPESERADNYVKQLEMDHKDDFKIETIKRVSETSFEVVYTSGIRVLLTYTSRLETDYKCTETKIELL